MVFDVGCSQTAASKIWNEHKVVKGNHAGRTRKVPMHQQRKFKAKCLENRKSQEMKKKLGRNGIAGRSLLREMGFAYTKAKCDP